MKKIVYIGIVFILAVAQITFFNYLRVFGVKPDLLLVSMVFACLVFLPGWALLIGVFCGILKDAFGVSAFGLNTLLFTLWSFLIPRLAREISIENNYLRGILVFVVAVVHNTAIGIVFIYLGSLIPLGVFLRIVLLGSLYTALLSPLVFRLIEVSGKKFTSAKNDPIQDY